MDAGNATNFTRIGPNTTDIKAYITYPGWLTFWFIVMIFLCILGAFSNSLLFMAIVTSRKLRKGSGTLIAHSILIEAFLCVIGVPLIMASTYMPQFGWPSKTMCKWTMLLFYGPIFAGTWASVLIAINRFVAIFFPHVYSKLTTPPLLALVIALGWAVALASSVPMFFEAGGISVGATKPWYACGARQEKPGYLYNFLVTVGTTAPAVALGVIYVSIFTLVIIRALIFRRKIDTTDKAAVARNQRAQAMTQKRLKMARMLFVSYIWFTVCYMPAPVTASVAPVLYGTSPLVSLFLRMLLEIGYATSPVIYLTMNAEYRSAAKRVLYRILRLCRPSLLIRDDTIKIVTEYEMGKTPTNNGISA
ncbi:protein trapped in endoderm-1-like [Paramacrobiotus metropolitanus]|uniref:protein trapped in endoderm-1-like n=1 Tax=Paramacrobiotus metropolitanus TaxID=2943436 RepID=UPI00244641ED|nr:protein trapped in endoderm-1-like [Paramacrobiotus metropolitanus]